MRGGLDDALEKLARRDELRRRANGEATGTPPAVQELVEAIAAVVGRNASLAVTVGVEGAGDPTLLHFAVEDGVVQVSVDNAVASRVADAAPAAPKHADFDIDLEEPYPAYPGSPVHPVQADPGQETRRISVDDRDRFDPGTGYPYAEPAYPSDTFLTGSAADFVGFSEDDRRYEGLRRYDDLGGSSHDVDVSSAHDSDFSASASDFLPRNGGSPATDFTPPNGMPAVRESAFPMRDGGGYTPHPFAATPPPPVPPQTSRRAHAEQHRAPEGQTFGPRVPEQRQPAPAPAQRGMPTPLPEPIPLKLDTEEAELAAKRLAALLRDNPSLLQQSPPD